MPPVADSTRLPHPEITFLGKPELSQGHFPCSRCSGPDPRLTRRFHVLQEAEVVERGKNLARDDGSFDMAQLIRFAEQP